MIGVGRSAVPPPKEKAAFSGGPFSGARGARTPDLVAASHALSQLSYGPKFVLDGVVYPFDLVISRGRRPEVDDATPIDSFDRDVVALFVSRAIGSDRVDLARGVRAMAQPSLARRAE